MAAPLQRSEPPRHFRNLHCAHRTRPAVGFLPTCQAYYRSPRIGRIRESGWGNAGKLVPSDRSLPHQREAHTSPFLDQALSGFWLPVIRDLILHVDFRFHRLRAIDLSHHIIGFPVRHPQRNGRRAFDAVLVPHGANDPCETSVARNLDDRCTDRLGVGRVTVDVEGYDPNDDHHHHHHSAENHDFCGESSPPQPSATTFCGCNLVAAYTRPTWRVALASGTRLYVHQLASIHPGSAGETLSMHADGTGHYHQLGAIDEVAGIADGE